jgi:hypothetical protein
MKLSNLAIVAAVGGLIFITPPKADALVVAFEYEFTADAGQPTDFNGSTIILRPSFYNPTIVLLGWDLKDSAVPGFQPLTINNSSIELQSFTDDSPTNWDGSFTVGNATDTFFGANAGDAGSLSATIDPMGHWTEFSAVAAAPDAASSGALLVGALGILGLGRRFCRG